MDQLVNKYKLNKLFNKCKFQQLEIDSYDILINSIKLVTNLDGLTCEIGIREGGSSYKIMREKVRFPKNAENQLMLRTNFLHTLEYS